MNIDSILGLPLVNRIQKLNDHINNIEHVVEVHNLPYLFQKIVSDIFGLGQDIPVGWNLIKVDQKCDVDQLILNFLSHKGAIFKIIYKLLSHVDLKFQFPIQYLPEDVQQSLKDGIVKNHFSPKDKFYSEKLSNEGTVSPRSQSAKSVGDPTLKLNPFEFYMFHFVKYVTNFRREDCLPHVDTIYQKLLAEYCLKFLPLSDNTPVQPSITYSQNISVTNSSILRCRTDNHTSLLKTQVLQNLNTSVCEFTNRGEIWRSELMIHLFTIYLCQIDERIDTGNPYVPVFPTLLDDKMKLSNQNGNFNNRCQRFYPTIHEIKCLRFIIKHFHEFSSHNLQDSSALGQLRREIIPLIQDRLYHFFYFNFNHCKFGYLKLYIETWLSYIQPWRYFSSNNTDDNAILNSLNLSTSGLEENQWINFIADNIAAYSTLFSLALDQFNDVIHFEICDNAHMVFHVAKIFSAPELCKTLKKIEHDMYTSNDTFGNIYKEKARHTLLRLQNPNHVQKRIFDRECYDKVLRLLEKIDFTILNINESIEQRRRKAEYESQNCSFWKSFQNQLNSFFMDSVISTKDEQTVLDYLNKAKEMYCIIFDIHLPVITPKQQSEQNMDSVLTSNSSFTLEDLQKNNSVSMEEMQRKRIQKYKYEGDPDYYPVRSYEIPGLVRDLRKISETISQKYHNEIQEYYNGEDTLSFMIRSILQPPLEIKEWIAEPNDHMRRLVCRQLPARISLRHFASWWTMFKCIFWAFIISCMLGSNMMIGFFLFFILWYFFTFLKYCIVHFIKEFQ